MKLLASSTETVLASVPLANGAVTTSGFTDFVNTQLIGPLFLLGAVIAAYFFITGKKGPAMMVMGGVLLVIAFLGLTANWQGLSRWIAGLFGQ